ncbi:MAG: AAA family ATPase [Beijerinckiaceae bacterium]|nr:AAA family ATPase [Beijerinckiaceae bacterium]
MADAARFHDESFGTLGEPSGPAFAQKPVPPVKIHWHGEATPVRRELVKGLLPRNGLAVLAGQSGAGKTFLALELASCLATGDDFFGHKVRDRGGSLFLLAEGLGTIAERLEAIRLGKLAEEPLGEGLPIAWMALPGSLKAPEVQKAVTAKIVEVSADMRDRFGIPLRLLVIDTLSAAFATGEDKNADGVATQEMAILQKMAEAAGALALIVAHYGKDADTGIRGSSAYTASADAILAVLAEREAATGKVSGRRVAMTKSRWLETGWNAGFDLCSIEVGKDEDGEPVLSAFIVPGEASLEPVKPKRPLSKPVTILLQAFRAVVADSGEPVRPHGLNGHEFTAVPREVLRREFYQRYPADGDTEAKRAESKKKAFQRALTDGQLQGAIGFKDEGEAWVWLV